MSTDGITLYGAGGHCKVVLDILESNGLKANRIVDDSPTEDEFMGLPLSKAGLEYDKAIITIGNCSVRKKIVESKNVFISYTSEFYYLQKCAYRSGYCYRSWSSSSIIGKNRQTLYN